MALGAKQHQQALARDLVLMVAEQALGGRVQRQDAAGRIERDRAVGRAVEHRLKVARRTAARRRLASGGAQSRPQFRLERAAQRDQRRRRAVPADRLRVAVDREDLLRPPSRSRPRPRPRRASLADRGRGTSSRARSPPEILRNRDSRRDRAACGWRKARGRRARRGRRPAAGPEWRRRCAEPHRRRRRGRAPRPDPLLGAGRSGVRAPPRPFVRVIVARSRRAADQRARDFPESVALAAAEFDALGGEALRRLAGQRVERARADRNDIGQHGWAPDGAGRKSRRCAQAALNPPPQALGEPGAGALVSIRSATPLSPSAAKDAFVGASSRFGSIVSRRGRERLRRAFGGAPSGSRASSAARIGSPSAPGEISGGGGRGDIRRRDSRFGSIGSAAISPAPGSASTPSAAGVVGFEPRPAVGRLRRAEKSAAGSARPRSPRPARQSRDSPEIRDDGRISAQPKA